MLRQPPPEPRPKPPQFVLQRPPEGVNPPRPLSLQQSQEARRKESLKLSKTKSSSAASVLREDEEEMLWLIQDYYQDDVASYHLAVTLYAFQGQSQFNELSFAEDQLVLLTRIDANDGWYEGYIIGPLHETVQKLEKGLRENEVGAGNERNWLGNIATTLHDEPFGLIPASYLHLLKPPQPASKIDENLQQQQSPQEDDEQKYNETCASSKIAPISPLTSPSSEESQRRLSLSSPFVVSGAETFVLKGNEEKQGRSLWTLPWRSNSPLKAEEPSTSDVHYITAGPRWAWPPPIEWQSRVRYIQVLLRDAQHHAAWAGVQQWTSFEVVTTTTTMTDPQRQQDSSDSASALTTVSVRRRYTHFDTLQRLLKLKYPMLLVPSLPSKQYNGRFQPAFIEKRMRSLSRWLARLLRHPVLSRSDAVSLFLTAGAGQSYEEATHVWEEAIKKLQESSFTPSEQGSFFRHVFHPEFNVAADEEEPTDDDGVTITAATGNESWTGDVAGIRQVDRFVRWMVHGADQVQKSMLAYRSLMHTALPDRLNRLGSRLNQLVQDHSGGRSSLLQEVDESMSSDAAPVEAANEEDRNEIQPEETSLMSPREDYFTARDELFTDTPFTPTTKVATTTESSSTRQRAKTVVWCHHGPSCSSCPHLTRALLSLSSTFTLLASVQTEHATDNLDPLTEQMGDWVEQSEERSAYLCRLHEDAARVGRSLAHRSPEDRLHQMARLQTVFNTTHAEMDHWFHQERCLEWMEMAEGFVHAEMERLQASMKLVQECQDVIQASVQAMHAAQR